MSVQAQSGSPQEEIKYSTCYMCACRCGIKVTLRGGKVRYIQGNPNHPTNQGVLCGKGSAGIMKQYSPAKLTKPLLRTGPRGSGQFKEIEWDEALALAEKWLGDIRQTDPKKLAFFTGRDQMQALTGLWATQFGTPNYAAHGGFCSVNMAAAGLYTFGGSFWEFGTPDWDRTKYFMMWGIAEDHDSNPIKIGIEKVKRNGAKFVSINPVRTGYSAVADEWVPVRPGTDGLLAMGILNVLLNTGNVDEEFLVRYTNSPYLVIDNPGKSNHGLIYRNGDGKPLAWDLEQEGFVDATAVDIAPALFGNYSSPEGLTLKTAFTLMVERYGAAEYAPEAVADQCGVPAEQIRRLALEMAHVAFKEEIRLPVKWTDWAGREHDEFVGRPISMHAMRGISAHSNGFHTCRAIHFIQILLGSIDCPGGFRYKPPFPKPIPPHQKPVNDLTKIQPMSPLPGAPLGFPTAPEDLFMDADGKAVRIDKAYSWEAPIAAHGLMHMVITNAVNGDPYPIDTLFMFMANMSWNSTMNTSGVMEMLQAKGEDGAYKIPHLIYCDAYYSEMVSFSDLVLPDTTYLERFDTISMLDRPISEADGPADSIRQPLVELDRDVRPFQEVLVELASRLKFPAFTHADGSRKFSGYKQFITHYERAPGVGFLSGWRGENGDQQGRGAPNPNQWEKYIENQCFWQYHLPEHMRFMKHVNRDYLNWAVEMGYIGSAEPIIFELYSEPMQKFKLAGQGLYEGPRPKEKVDAERLATFFDPLPIWYAPLEQTRIDEDEYPFHAINQRPMIMYHSWDTQNAWQRQIISQNYLYMNRKAAAKLGIEDLSWAWVESHHGKIRVQVKLMEGVEEHTVWTWNAIGKQSGAWNLDPNASEARKGFLMNHLISELLPEKEGERRITNSDPVTGQGAWYDLRVKIRPAAAGEEGSWPQHPTIGQPDFLADRPETLRYKA
ncbi:MAG: formate dehydrogenase [Alphaproteobacteria bacterium CG_4_10_14_0_2_um_filter_63_37]|nr:MAG: formate dehydrogenase [Proteobacteria bacterium CG1_02_64_396]PJA25620.1 MAG: formate dehydrogenase [Alphaproteobacteria bacterium CG_4_10_14_0_2_um_filter_63_37]